MSRFVTRSSGRSVVPCSELCLAVSALRGLRPAQASRLVTRGRAESDQSSDDKARRTSPTRRSSTMTLVGGIRDPSQPSNASGSPERSPERSGRSTARIHTAKTDPGFRGCHGPYARPSWRSMAIGMTSPMNWTSLDAALEFGSWRRNFNPHRHGGARSTGGTEPACDQAPGMVAAFREQRQVLRACKRLADRFNALSPADRQRLGRYQPDSLYDDAPPAELGGSGARVWPTLNLFDAATDALADPASAPTVPPGAPPEEEHDEILVGPRLMFASTRARTSMRRGRTGAPRARSLLASADGIGRWESPPPLSRCSSTWLASTPIRTAAGLRTRPRLPQASSRRPPSQRSARPSASFRPSRATVSGQMSRPRSRRDAAHRLVLHPLELREQHPLRLIRRAFAAKSTGKFCRVDARRSGLL